MDQTITLVLFNSREARAEIGKQVQDYDKSMLPNHHYTGGKPVVRIYYHEPKGNGDCHYVVLVLSDGKSRRIFDIDEILWE